MDKNFKKNKKEREREGKREGSGMCECKVLPNYFKIKKLLNLKNN